MPISFLTPAQRENYGRYAASPTPDQLSRFFHLSDDDLREIRSCRGEHNRLGFALQLSTVRYLGTFLDHPVAVPAEVVQTLAHQLDIANPDALRTYGTGKQRWDHAARIQISFGYSDITEPRVAMLKCCATVQFLRLMVQVICFAKWIGQDLVNGLV